MKIGCSQRIIKTGYIEYNLNHYINDLSFYSDEGVNLIVFPEMWATGFDYKRIFEHAEVTESTIEEICKKLDNNQLAILSLPEKSSEKTEISTGKVYNTIFAVTNNRIVAKYRKTFLFSPLKEDMYFAKGDLNIPVFEFGGFNISLHTCYEIRFPEVFRIAAFKGSNLMIIPAIWPESKKDHWLTLLRGRAIENQAYIVGCNASEVINDKKTILCGNTAVFDPWGGSIGYLENGSNRLIVEITKEKVDEVRQTIPSLSDAKSFFEINKKICPIETNKEELCQN